MFELQKKQKEIKNIYKTYDKSIKEAKKRKEPDGDIEYLVHEMFDKTYVIEEDIKILVSQNWIQKAEKLYLPIPDSSDSQYWEVGENTHIYYLKPSGISYVRNLVREEIAARRKAVLEWTIPIIGIIGAVTGLIAVILK